MSLEQVLGDDGALDLVGALADHHERSVAIEALGRSRRRQSPTAENAQGVGGRLLGALRGVELGHARFEITALAAILHARRPVGEKPRAFHPEGDGGERGRRFGQAEGGVGRLFEGGLGHSHRPRRDVDAPGLEPREDVPEAAAFDAAHEVVDRTGNWSNWISAVSTPL